MSDHIIPIIRNCLCIKNLQPWRGVILPNNETGELNVFRFKIYSFNVREVWAHQNLLTQLHRLPIRERNQFKICQMFVSVIHRWSLYRVLSGKQNASCSFLDSLGLFVKHFTRWRRNALWWMMPALFNVIGITVPQGWTSSEISILIQFHRLLSPFSAWEISFFYAMMFMMFICELFLQYFTPFNMSRQTNRAVEQNKTQVPVTFVDATLWLVLLLALMITQENMTGLCLF